MKNNKRFVLSALVFAVTLALVSCKPLQGHAVEIDIGEQTGIYDYLDTAGENLQQIDFSLDSDQDGNRSVRLKIYGLQKLAFSEQSSFFDSLDFGSAPDTMTVSGGGGCGLCQKPNDSEYYTVMFHNGSSVLAESSFFRLIVSSSNNSNSFSTPSFGSFSNIYGATVSGLNRYDTINCSDSLGYFSNTFSAIAYAGGSMSIYCASSTSGIPVLQPQSVSNFLSSSTTVYRALAGLSENIVLPSGTVDSSRPWDYYNNVLLPYMEDEFPGYDEYFVFPDGYDPPAQPSTVPVEYPTLPGFDLALETNGTQPASDYAYNIPDMPTKDIAVPSFDFSNINPAEVMAPVAEHLRSMWALITGVLTEFGLFPYVAIAVFAAIVAGLLRLGK